MALEESPISKGISEITSTSSLDTAIVTIMGDLIIEDGSFETQGTSNAFTTFIVNHYGNIRKMTYWQRFKDKFRGRWAAMKKKQFFDGLVDHSIGLYADKLKKVYKDSL